ncbi:MAG: 5-formyltetrahydrofolate cyclo-ligase [Roseburia sp.]|nr:5-formyltetrahydrofolate cyclo-ligase [Roseburia sp.]
MPERRSCRKYYKELRDNMAPRQVIVKSEAICRQVLSSVEYKEAETIFAYYPLGNEVNCLPVLQQALLDEKRVVLPRTAQDCQMDFYEIQSLDDVEEGSFHVMEPKDYCERFEPVIDCIRPCDLDWKEQLEPKIMALVPGIVFDREGNRYGYGKGYYDRYFARFPQLKRIALAYTEQLSKELLECAKTDVKMHVILTDAGRIDII